MAFYWSDNVHTTAFTPRDYQVELLAAACEKNIIVCLGHNSSKEFIALKLIHEHGYELRRCPEKVTIFLSNESARDSAFSLIYHLTDLKVCNLNTMEPSAIDWDTVFQQNQVVIMDPTKCLDALVCSYLCIESVNLLIIEDCHKKRQCEIRDIFQRYCNTAKNCPRILGLAGPLHSAGCVPGRLGAELEYLEKDLHCTAETASDIVTVLRYCSKPEEIILQCTPSTPTDLTEYLCEIVNKQKLFLKDHRFDPSEIYGEGFEEELEAMPDPKKEPLEFLDQFLDVLYNMGPWCADRAACNLLIQIEKSKVKTPYERHFILLCMVATTFVKVRACCDLRFQEYKTEKERIAAYSSHKVLRLLEVLRAFAPELKEKKLVTVKPKEKDSVQGDKPTHTAQSTEIGKIDFIGLGNAIEKISLNVEKESSEENDVRELKTALENLTSVTPVKLKSPLRQVSKSRNRRRPSGQPRPARNNQYHNDSDLLCGLIFCNCKFTAKILFTLVYEMSRYDPELRYLNVQYTVDRMADPITAAKEAEVEHRKQEEVLKRFRMHDCNLLIGTTVLEEGIDLPKCNLVIRWDPPTTYRSYVQCKGRARSAHAFYILMLAPEDSNKNDSRDRSAFVNQFHRMICQPKAVLTNGHSPDEDHNEQYSVALAKCNGRSDVIENDAYIEEIVCNGKKDNDEDKKVVRTKIEELVTVEKSEQTVNVCCLSNEDDDLNVFLQNMYNEKCSVDRLNQATTNVIKKLAQYMEIEKMLLRKCANIEPQANELEHADTFTSCIEAYKPSCGTGSVNLSTAVALVNKYCAKLPSDTFTKLTPLWRCATTKRNGVDLFQCTIRLPINSPYKRDIVGLPMPTRILARRVAALITCIVLHKNGELDNNLQPIGKEGFRASEADWENFELEPQDELIVSENFEPRPGTTKRRQYYYKRISEAFTDCRPTVGAKTYLYHINMTLECPIPEEQNTRGRKIYPPEDAMQSFGILTTREIPKISAFPIFTRSGEVRVSIDLISEDVVLNECQLSKINTFLNYTFTNVLRLQKYLMLFDPDATENSFFIVPVVRLDGNGDDIKSFLQVDWDFLESIEQNSEKMPELVPDEKRRDQQFDPNLFKDAVVMPWYRNQDQPQYFYVAEICDHLSPESAFPGENYPTFKEYYFKKYNITIQNGQQPLLDVDHTSARLNFLTPRYVNRKGVALPTSSEETKKAKRENLEQKQILVPELCTVHPFPASLWRAVVCLPCILYRINALLLADEIRKMVAYDLGLGQLEIVDKDFQWRTLDFGWSLAEVLRKSREAKDCSGMEEEKEVEVEEIKELVKEECSPIPESDDEIIKTANDLLEEAEDKLKDECVMEIGTWSNDMAENIKGDEFDEEDDWGLLPSNINMCSRKKTQIRYGSPTSWSVGSTRAAANNKINAHYFSDSDDSYQSDDEFDSPSTGTDDDISRPGKLRIEFKSDNVAEAIESEADIAKRQKKLAIMNDINANEMSYQITKNIGSGFDSYSEDDSEREFYRDQIIFHEEEFESSTTRLQNKIKESGILFNWNQKFEVKKPHVTPSKTVPAELTISLLHDIIPFVSEEHLKQHLEDKDSNKEIFSLSVDDLIKMNRQYLMASATCQNGKESYIVEGAGDLFDNFNDNAKNQKQIEIDYSKELIESEFVNVQNRIKECEPKENDIQIEPSSAFSFDHQPDLDNHPGPSPSIILQGLTMSNANDGINLERLETIGDSFLKYAITTYLYCTYENVHEGKLSHLRSKQVSNLNLYRLGRRKVLGESMIATKFEPHDNWLPPCYYVPKELEKALIEANIPACYWNLADLPNIKGHSTEEICELVRKKAEALGLDNSDYPPGQYQPIRVTETISENISSTINDTYPCFIPYNLVTQHSIPDKSVADCVEALIGAYLIACGPRGALLFMAWLGIRVLPVDVIPVTEKPLNQVGVTRPFLQDFQMVQNVYGHWSRPKSPLLMFAPNPHETLELLLDGYSAFEDEIGYKFRDRSYLLQAMTHASYSPNRLTDCYQRLEFLGDAVLDYLITRHLYEDPRQHSPGALTDLRSALVNNTIFASLAVRHRFHKYFRHLSPGLNEVIDRFVRIQHENGHSISEEFYLISEEECDEAEDVEVPKALGDVFESVAGAIFLDSNMSLDTVWKVFSNMMQPEIEQFSNSVPKSPIRELLELEPETAKFSKPEKLADGRRVRVTVEVFGKGTFSGIGRNYRIAKCTAAKCALRQLKKHGLISKKH